MVSGAAGKNARCFDSREEMALALKQEAREGDVILFKGSRGMRLELVLDQFLDEQRD